MLAVEHTGNATGSGSDTVVPDKRIGRFGNAFGIRFHVTGAIKHDGVTLYFMAVGACRDPRFASTNIKKNIHDAFPKPLTQRLL
ncbi:hypothetical protein GCM10007071_25430 [Marinobacter zhanjiangensis]|uniref:Transposase DDE domain-containing protein n=1 Tax=Marinobacter zhanjiangensis TaxID=578215 RepID=A0ABQ3B736_9GAMM|nr:hypothetical protein GCM10007071_25430 [Marinobacter zhanjiangensis]